MSLTSVFATILGLTAGILSAIVFSKYQAIEHKHTASPIKIPLQPTTAGAHSVYYTLPALTDGVSKGMLVPDPVAAAVNSESKLGVFDPRLNSTFLSEKVKVLCFVILQRSQIGNFGKAAKATWTKHCNKVILLSSVLDANIGTIDIQMPEGRGDVWLRTKLALQYVHEHFKDAEYDWFVKAGHDSFLVPENLRYLLLMHRANIPNYIGHVFSGPKSGGSVFAMSKQGLNLIAPTLDACKSSFGGVADDLDLGECLRAAGAVSSSKGKDTEGVQRFRMIVPDHKLPLNTKGYTTWYWQYIRYPEKEGPECCSDYSISFHYISPNNMYLLEYMIYHMRPFGVGHYTCPANMGAILSKLGTEKVGEEAAKSDKVSEVHGGQSQDKHLREGNHDVLHLMQ